MKIISKFKDYYDSVGHAFGASDDTVLYLRAEEVIEVKYGPVRGVLEKPEEVMFPVDSIVDDYFVNDNGNGVGYKTYLIGFCGKTYLAAHMYERAKTGLGYQNIVDKWTYDKEVLIKFMESYQRKPTIWYEKRIQDRMVNQIHKAFEEVHNKEQHDLFHYVNSPVFRLHNVKKQGIKGEIHKNAPMKDVQLYQIIDPYTAYQDVEQYLSGVLGNTEVPAPTLSEKQAVTSHGFDSKYAFRTRPKK